MIFVNPSLFLKVNQLLKEKYSLESLPSLKCKIVYKKSPSKGNEILQKLENWIDNANDLDNIILEEEQKSIDLFMQSNAPTPLKKEKKRSELSEHFFNLINQKDIFEFETSIPSSVRVVPTQKENKSVLLTQAFENIKSPDPKKEEMDYLIKKLNLSF